MFLNFGFIILMFLLEKKELEGRKREGACFKMIELFLVRVFRLCTFLNLRVFAEAMFYAIKELKEDCLLVISFLYFLDL